jgi:transaldolase
MEFFLDTAEIKEIKAAKEWGILDGVTTNPSLMLKSGRKDFHNAIKEICEIAQGPVSAEVTCSENDYDEMVKQARELAKLNRHVVVKIPFFPAGVKAIKTLSAEGIKTNCTLIFSANQALIAAKAGATYVSPFVGRIDDAGQDGMLVVQEIRQVFDNYEYKTKILAASLRHPIHVKQAALYGADVATIPFNVMESLFKHPLTDAGQKRFMEDWAKLQGK